jgi:hypothetical protein
MIGKNQIKGLLADKEISWRYQVVKDWLNKLGWKITEEHDNFIMAEKEGFVAIPGKSVFIWDAKRCLLCTILFHEDRNRYTVLFRKVIFAKALFRTIYYPRQHLSKGQAFFRYIKHYKTFPAAELIVQLWQNAIKNDFE